MWSHRSRWWCVGMNITTPSTYEKNETTDIKQTRLCMLEKERQCLRDDDDRSNENVSAMESRKISWVSQVVSQNFVTHNKCCESQITMRSQQHPKLTFRALKIIAKFTFLCRKHSKWSRISNKVKVGAVIHEYRFSRRSKHVDAWFVPSSPAVDALINKFFFDRYCEHRGTTSRPGREMDGKEKKTYSQRYFDWKTS